MNNKILLVDDSAQVVRAFKHILEEAGYRVETASDGIEAISVLQDFKPDALLVDMIMPKLQGDKLCRLIRSREGLKDLFIIVLSAVAAEKQINVREFGGDVCIAKGPLAKLKPIVLDLLERRSKDPAFRGPETTLGLDGVYKRSITSELLAGRDHASVVLDNISDGIVELTGEGRMLFANPRASFFMGRPEEDLLATDFLSWFDESAAKELREHMILLPKSDRREPVDMVVSLRDRILVVNMVYLEDEFGSRIIVLMKDITGYKKVEQDLMAALGDKDMLLKEVHHRVKNNLAMVGSLVSLELGNVSCEEDAKILRDLRSRIDSISLVHDKLYKSCDMTHLNLNEFIHDLVENILALSPEPEKPFLFTGDIPDILVTVDTAIPLALMLSELVTNAIKYAFGGDEDILSGKDAVIEVRFSFDARGHALLEVRDNGRGFGEGFSAGAGDSLGWKLVESLTAQLEGSVEYRNDNGAVITITLPEEVFAGSDQ